MKNGSNTYVKMVFTRHTHLGAPALLGLCHFWAQRRLSNDSKDKILRRNNGSDSVAAHCGNITRQTDQPIWCRRSTKHITCNIHIYCDCDLDDDEWERCCEHIKLSLESIYRNGGVLFYNFNTFVHSGRFQWLSTHCFLRFDISPYFHSPPSPRLDDGKTLEVTISPYTSAISNFSIQFDIYFSAALAFSLSLGLLEFFHQMKFLSNFLWFDDRLL